MCENKRLCTPLEVYNFIKKRAKLHRISMAAMLRRLCASEAESLVSIYENTPLDEFLREIEDCALRMNEFCRITRKRHEERFEKVVLPRVERLLYGDYLARAQEARRLASVYIEEAEEYEKKAKTETPEPKLKLVK